MNNPQPNSLMQAVFTVCPSAEVAAAVGSACAELSGSSYVGGFAEYFDGERRVQFTADVLHASGAVAFVDCDRNAAQALVTMQRIHAAGLRNVRVVGLGTAATAEFLLGAMRAGCNEFLPKPVDSSVLKETLKNLQVAHTAQSAASAVSGRVIALLGAKGGVGTTTLAVHLAQLLVRRHHKSVLLVDYHYELGHAAIMLGIKSGQYHFDELLRNVSRLDADLLKGLVTKHTSGLDVLTAPDICSEPHAVAAEDAQAILRFLTTQYDYVLIDSSMDYTHGNAPYLELADEIFMIANGDVATLRDLARRTEHVALTQNVNGSIRVVLNRSTPDDAVSAQQVEAAVRHPVWITIPDNYADLVRALNAGELLPIDHRSAFAQQLAKWAHRLVTNNAPPPDSKSEKRVFSGWRKGMITTLVGLNG